MKLNHLTKDILFQAARKIDMEGIPVNYQYNNYWVVFPNGKEYPFKHLVRIANQISGFGNTKFESNDGYRAFVQSLGFEVKFSKHTINFFEEEEIDFFSSVAGKPYRSDSVENVKQSDRLKPLVLKVNYWARFVEIGPLNAKFDKHWQWSGTFKKYLWIRFMDPELSNKVFFGVTIQDGYLIIDLDCLRSNHSGSSVKPLPKDKVDLFFRVRDSFPYSQIKIGKDELKEYDWDKLHEKTKNFFETYLDLYYKLESVVTEEEVSISEERPALIETEPPASIKSKSLKKGEFKGVSIDFEKKHRRDSALGRLGEELILNYERKRFSVNPDIQNKIQKVPDGKGYDILSFESPKKEIFIEVKTTQGSISEPFYISHREVEFMRLNKKKYVLYRVYNYKHSTNTASFYRISGEDLNTMIFTPISFEVSI